MLHLRAVDDWIAIYIDGKRAYEGHSIDPRTLLDIIGVDYSSEYIEPDEYDEVTIEFPDGSPVFPDKL